MDKVTIPQFENKSDLFAYLVANKDSLIAQKKAITKEADGVSYYPTAVVDGKGEETVKENNPIPNLDTINEIAVKVVINTTNLMDSHMDVHIPGIWDKSLAENKNIMHIQEHKMGSFDKIISSGEDLKASVKTFSWSQLGQKFDGMTQALVFDSKVRKDRNGFMFDQYGKGFVKQHSVGMRYVQLGLAINDKEYGAEFEMWEKYLPEIANRSTAEDKGYFWVVKEAKVVEGSAVPLGSNQVTPTLDNNQKAFEPVKSTQEEPPKGTPNKSDHDFFGGW